MNDPDFGPSSPLAPSLFPSAVYSLPDLDALDAIHAGAPGFIYSRDGHPNSHQLAAKLAPLEGGSWGIVCGSGMGAISAALLGLLPTSGRVLASDRLYGRTTQLLRQHFARYGIETRFVDVQDLNATRNVVRNWKPHVLFAETLSNPLCRIPDLAALAEVCRDSACRFVVDNTFASPVLCRPLELGADVVMESLTKMIGGHSDVFLGFLAGRDADLHTAIANVVSVWGFAAGPFECWQVERGLITLGIRMQAAVANAQTLADWLGGQAGVVQVVYPGRADHPDHEMGRKLLPSGCGNMLCFEIAGGRDAVNRFMRAAPGVPFSPSFGHAHTTISYPVGASHRYDSPEERSRQGIRDGLIRVSVGCEPWEDLRAEVAKGLQAAASA